MKQIFEGKEAAPGGIMKFPEPASIEEWKNYKYCRDNRYNLLPYYFDPNSKLRNESVIKTLLGEIMIGINNTDELEQVLGLRVARIYSPFIGQVDVSHHTLLHFHLTFCYYIQRLHLGWHLPLRYEELFKNTSEDFLNSISVCYQNHLNCLKIKGHEPKPDFQGKSCLYHAASPTPANNSLSSSATTVASGASCEEIGFATITSVNDCQSALQEIGLSHTPKGTVDGSYGPAGCYLRSDGDLWYNLNGQSATPCSSESTCICRTGEHFRSKGGANAYNAK